MKLYESEKIDKYFDFAGELKRIQNKWVTMISIAVGVLETISKRLGKNREDYNSEKESRSSRQHFKDQLDWFGFLGFYGLSTIGGYLISNPLYTYISNIYDLVFLGFIAYQPLEVI